MKYLIFAALVILTLAATTPAQATAAPTDRAAAWKCASDPYFNAYQDCACLTKAVRTKGEKVLSSFNAPVPDLLTACPAKPAVTADYELANCNNTIVPQFPAEWQDEARSMCGCMAKHYIKAFDRLTPSEKLDTPTRITALSAAKKECGIDALFTRKQAEADRERAAIAAQVKRQLSRNHAVRKAIEALE